VNLASARLMGGELRYGRYGFYCSNGRKHVFHHLFSESSGTSMDIGPCEGDSCPFAQTHGLHSCQSCESCLNSRRITLDSGRDLKVHFRPRGWQGRGKNRRRACGVTIMRAGGLEPAWYHELAREAEAADGLTAGRPRDWLECKRAGDCRADEKGHHWSFEDAAGNTVKRPDGRYVLYRDSDNLAPDGAAQRSCSHCRETQMKRPDGRWSGDRDGCPCCGELPSEHGHYYCIRCGHGAPRSLVTQQERDYFSEAEASANGPIAAMTAPADMRRKQPGPT
jgi:hypothetical protein